MRFDKYMSCKNQVKHIKERCNERLNIIKVLSHHSWKINQDTLIQIYKSLIRSLIDYSLFIYPLLSSSNKSSLQVIQNNALRIILKKKIDTDIQELHKIGKIEDLFTRSQSLKNRYLNSAINNGNPLIKDDFLMFKKLKNNNMKTLLD